MLMGNQNGGCPRCHKRDPVEVGHPNRGGAARPDGWALTATTFGGVTVGVAVLYLTALLVAA